jgi:hypothetical protein
MFNRFVVLVFVLLLPGLAFGETARAYLMTTPSSVNHSELHILNTSTNAQSFTGTFYARSGDRLGSANRALHSGSLGPNQRLILDSSELATIFGVTPWDGPAMLEVTANSDFKLMVKLTSPSGFVSNTNCVTKNAVYNIEGFEQSDRSYIRFINIGDSTITSILGTLYNQEGTQIGDGSQLLLSSLAPKEQVFINNNDLATVFGSEWSGTAMLNVSSHSNLRLLNLNFANNETFFNFSCFESTQTDREISWQMSDLAGTWTGTGFPLPGSASSCVNSIRITATMTTNGYFSGTATNNGTGLSQFFDAWALTDGSFLVWGLAVDYVNAYGATFAGKFENDSLLTVYGRDTEDCYSVMSLTK